ncbi:hypothetical protein [Thauera humireducens]|uniref:hypothetical protein n=1 Tax=Thauera humireducens TaxID=1134435 RepID=UPI00311DB690
METRLGGRDIPLEGGTARRRRRRFALSPTCPAAREPSEVLEQTQLAHLQDSGCNALAGPGRPEPRHQRPAPLVQAERQRHAARTGAEYGVSAEHPPDRGQGHAEDARDAGGGHFGPTASHTSGNGNR